MGSPGDRVDRAALWALAATGGYLFFLNAWGSIPLACLLAFACCALARYALKGLGLPRRATSAQARAELLRVAVLPDPEAEKRLKDLIEKRYPGEDFTLAAVLKHPEASLSSGDVLNAWKAGREAGRLVIAATCPAEPRAALYARQLRDPVVAVVDSRALVRLLRAPGAVPVQDAPRSGAWRRLRDAAASALMARASLKNAAVAAALLALYWIRGNPLGLLAATALLWQLGAALLRRRVRRRLFD